MLIGKERIGFSCPASSKQKLTILLFVLVPLDTAFAACSFNRSDYEKITAGMKIGEVAAVLGCQGSYQGRDKSNGTMNEYYVWDVGSAYVSMRFRDGSLTYKVQHGLR